ncbi:MAG: flippase-like domain-containing protein [Anaerolineae bacterium]|nr:flippase-like domain-containing protein [Anaerolineae bacterium]
MSESANHLTPTPPKRRWPSVLLGVLVSVVALWLLLRRDFSAVQDELAHAHYWAVIPCLIVSVIGLWLRSIRWRVLLPGRLSAGHSFHILNVSYFINAVLPLRVGELARAGLAARLNPPVPVLTSLSTVVIERLLDTLAVFGLVGITLAILPAGFEVGLIGLVLGVGALVGVIVLAVFAARPDWARLLLDRVVLNGVGRVIPFFQRPNMQARLTAWLDHLLDGIAPLASVRVWLLAFAWTVAAWAASVSAGYVLLFALFDDPTWAAAMAFVALASFAIAVPAVPGNLGPFEAAVVFALMSADLVGELTDPRAIAFALLLHVVNLVTYIGAGLIGLWAEDVKLGDVTRAAQQIALGVAQSPKPNPPCA